MTNSLAKGGNAPLPTGVCAVTVTSPGAAIDVCAVLLSADGKVRGDDDLVFFNHPAQDGVALDGPSVRADLMAVPDAVDRVAVVVAVDPQGPAAHFDAGTTPHAVVTCGGTQLAFAPPPFTHRESAAVLVELYRRGGGWKVRAVGQGWDTGLAGLAADFGMVVDDDGTGSGSSAIGGSPTGGPSTGSPSTGSSSAGSPSAGSPSTGSSSAGIPLAGAGADAPPSAAPAPAAPVPAPAAATPGPAPTPASAGAPAAPAAPASVPAISLEKVERSAPGLVDLYKAARVCLEKKGVTGLRASVYLVLDHSGSMRGFYRNGSVQRLAEQALGLSANLDDDGVVPVVFFSHKIDKRASISLDDYAGCVDRLRKKISMGGTAYAAGMGAVIEHYRTSGSTDPAFVIFQTDGDPHDRDRVLRLLRRSSEMPIFWQFIGFGRSQDLTFLRRLDTLDGRKLDNTGYFEAGPRPLNIPDADLYDNLMKDFPTWLSAARAAGVVR